MAIELHQFNHMDDYKKVLGDQIKKLIDET